MNALVKFSFQWSLIELENILSAEDIVDGFIRKIANISSESATRATNTAQRATSMPRGKSRCRAALLNDKLITHLTWNLSRVRVNWGASIFDFYKYILYKLNS